MSNRLRSARINVKAIVILVVVIIVLLGGAAVGYKVRKRIIADKALAAGKAALERKDWAEACKQLRQYLTRYPEEQPDILARYAEANLAVRPLETENIAAAIAAYRHYLRHAPGEEKACHELADLYLQVGDFAEASYIARQRLEADPDDIRAKLALARALVNLGKPEEARTEWLEPLVEAHPDRVDAYLLLSEIARQDRSAGPDAALKWLDLAVANNPKSARALLARSAFHRQQARAEGSSSATQPAAGQPTTTPASHDEAALADLEAVDALQPRDPQILALAFQLWFGRGNLDRAEAELEALEAVDEQSLADSEVEPDTVKLVKYTAAGRLALRRKAVNEAVEIADRALGRKGVAGDLTGNQRLAFMETAIKLYLAGDRVESAGACLAELKKGLETRLAGDAELAEQISVLEASVIIKQPDANPFDAIDRLREVTITNPRNAQAWKLLGDAYLKTGQPLRAITAMEEFMGRGPDDPEGVLTLARLYLDQDPGKSFQYAANVEAAFPDDVQAKLVRVAAVMRPLRAVPAGVDDAQVRSRRAEVREELLKLRESHPGEVEVRGLLATLDLAEGKPEDGLVELRRAVKECDDKALAAIRLSSFAQEQGRTDEAMEAARQAIEFKPDLAAPRIQLARLHQSAHQVDQARQVLDQAVAYFKEQGEEWAKRIQPDPDDEAKRKVTELNERKLQAQLALSQLLLSFRDADTEKQAAVRKEGVDQLRNMANEHQQNAQLRLILLSLPEVRAKTDEAQKLVDELRRIEGDKGLLWPVEQARLWLAGDPTPAREQEIIELLTRVIEAGGGGPEPVLLLGAVHMDRAEFQKAEEVYRRSIAQRPIFIPVVTELLTLLERQSRFDEASALLERLPKDVAALSEHRVRVGAGLGDFEAAVGEVQERIKTDPGDAASLVTLARLIYAHKKDVKAAFELLDQAESLSPDLPAVLATRVGILQVEGRQDEALTLLDREVTRRNDFATYQLRAAAHAAAGRVDLAEQDYRHLTTFTDFAARGYEALGRYYGSVERVDEAIAAAEAGLRLAPQDRGLQRLLAAALITRTEPDTRSRGRQMVDDLLKQEPNDVGLLLLKAEAVLRDGDPASHPEAAGILERVIGLDPRRVGAHLYLIDLAAQDGDRMLVRQRIVRALEANPDDENLLMAKTMLEVESNNLPLAEEIAERIVAKNARYVPALNLLADLALRRDDVEAGERYNAQALAADPGNEAASLAQAAILTARGKPGEALFAVETYRKTEAGGKSVNACLVLADLHRRAQRFEDAGRALDDAEKLAPAAPAVLLARMVWLNAQKRLDDLVALVNSPPDGTPDVPALQEVAVAMLASSGEAGQIQAAKGLCQRIIEADPGRVSARVKLGQLSYAADDLAAAEQAYRQALELEPDHSQALNDLAWILGTRTGQTEEAIRLADRGVARYPADPHLRDTRGAILMRLGRLDEARADLEQCLPLAQNTPDTRARALSKLGEVLAKLQRVAEARQRYSEALELDEEHHAFTDAERTEIRKALAALPQ